MKKMLAVLTVGILGVGLVACSNDKPVEPTETPVAEVSPTPEVEPTTTPEVVEPEVEPTETPEVETTEEPEIIDSSVDAK